MTVDGLETKRKRQREPIAAKVHLDAWAARGASRADLDGRQVLIDRGIPGETVIAEVARGRGPKRGIVVDVLDPSPVRIDAPCPFYHAGCGGCQWQHMTYPAQVDARRLLVDRELERAGLDVRVGRCHAMSEPWRYRRTAAIAIGWEAGFRPRGRRGIVALDDCPISHPLIGRLAARLNDLLRAATLPNYHAKVWLDCTVVGSGEALSLQVLIQGITGLTLEDHPELPEVGRVLASLDEVTSVAYRHRSGEPRVLEGDLMSTIDVAGDPVYLPAGSFSQTNLGMLDVLIGRMREELTARPASRVADVYGGVGTFALTLAPLVEGVTLIELDALAVEAARRTARLRDLGNVDFVAAHAERALSTLQGVDLAIVDPPRSGLGPIVTDALAAARPDRIFYVSCAPPSLATDLAGLVAAGYRVRSLDVFDFYPQTYHVESFAVLER